VASLAFLAGSLELATAQGWQPDADLPVREVFGQIDL